MLQGVARPTGASCDQVQQQRKTRKLFGPHALPHALMEQLRAQGGVAGDMAAALGAW